MSSQSVASICEKESTKRKMSSNYFHIRLINPTMDFDDLKDLIEVTLLVKYNNMQIEKVNMDERYFVINSPFFISPEKVMEVMTELSNIPMSNYIVIDNSDEHLLPGMEEKRNELKKRYNPDASTSSTDGPLKCEVCGISFARKLEWNNHEKSREHLDNVIKKYKHFENLGYFMLTGKSAFKNRVATIIFLNRNPEFSISQFFDKIEDNFVKFLNSRLDNVTSLKINCNLYAYYEKISGEEQLFNLNTSNVTLFKNDDIAAKIYNEIYPQIDLQNDELNMGGSGWSFKFISELEVRLNRNDVLKRAGTFIETPSSLKLKYALINVKNEDDRCFYYCIFAKFVSTRPNRVESYKNIEKKLEKERKIKFDFGRVNYPATLNDIKNFEKSNDKKVSINVYVYERRKILPIKVCEKERNLHYDLLMLKNKDTSHYVYIKNFSRLVSNQISSLRMAVAVCKRCLTHYVGRNKGEKLAEHKRFCNNEADKNPSKFELPEKGNNILKFKNFKHEKPIDYIGFADFETMLKPVETNTELSSQVNTRKFQEHIPIAFCFYIVHAQDIYKVKDNGKLRKPKKPVCYVGKNAANVFFKMIKKVAIKIGEKYKKHQFLDPSSLSWSDRNRFWNDRNCCICGMEFRGKQYRVRHHRHTDGVFEGPAHVRCNLLYTVPNFLPIFIHNLSRYDSHLILRGYKQDQNEIKVLPNTEENYISFSKKVAPNFWIKFVDSYRFLSSSLRSLIDILPRDEMIYTRAYFSEVSHFQLVTKKGFFCYDYLDSEQKLYQTEIPSREDFYNQLNDESISREDYEHAVKVWNCFECRNLAEYLTVYVIADCLLLADVFISFRKTGLKNYGLDPCYFVSLPGYGFEAMLRVTGVELEQLTDINMFLFFEKAMRGGITNTVVRYAESNNVHIQETYDKFKPPVSIFYTDANNLYGFSMSKVLPKGKFEWVNDEEVENFTADFILNLEDESEIGYYLEVDLQYPTELHRDHNSFPFAPERKKPPKSKTSKLLCTLENKINYVCYYENLKTCLEHGLILKKVHKVLQFEQTNFLLPFIELNTMLRQNAQNDFEVNLYKLIINSCFGKCLENEKSYMNFKLVCSAKQFSKSVSKPTFKNSVIFSKNLVGIHFHKALIKLTKPIYAGVTVLEKSRNFMYKFYYEELGKIFHDLEFPQLLYMDTDSFILSVKTDDIHPYIKDNPQIFDTSNFPPDHPLFSSQNRKVPGFFKDELGTSQCLKFISLSPKVYSLKFRQNEIKKIKGIKKSVIKKEINFEDFYACLFGNKELQTRQLQFQSSKHKMFTISQRKKALVNFCDKRYFYDNINSLAYGHYEIDNISTQDSSSSSSSSSDSE